MGSMEEDSLQLIHNLQKYYFEQRNLDAVAQLLDENIRWFGTGSSGCYTGLAQTQAMIRQEQAAFKGSFHVLHSQYEAAPLADGLCMVDGVLTIQENGWELSAKAQMRLSAICARAGDAVKLRQFHLSIPDGLGSAEEIPQLLAGENCGTLRRQLDRQFQRLKRSNRDLQALTNNIPGGVICCDCTQELNILQYSKGFLAMFGYTREDMKNLFDNRYINVVYEPDRKELLKTIRQQLSGASSVKEFEYRAVHKDGRIIWVFDRGQLVEQDGGQSAFYCMLMDVTETKKYQEELRLSLERHQIILNQTADIIFEWDIPRDIISLSSNWEKKFGYPPKMRHLSGSAFKTAHIHPDDLETIAGAVRNLKDGVSYVEAEMRIAHQDGRYLWCRGRATLQLDGHGRPAKAVGVIIDIDQEKQRVRRVEERAERDTLTGLYNKGTAQGRMEQTLKEMDASQFCALMILDVDNFKTVNDMYGHLSGDAMLTDIAGVLQKHFDSRDIIGRIGGDEFAVLMRSGEDREAVGRRAEELLAAFDSLMDKGRGPCRLSCSIGIALSPKDGRDFYTLYERADAALYYAKTRGKNGYDFYTRGRPRPGLEAAGRTFAGTQIDSDSIPGGLRNQLAEYVFHVLYQSMNIETALPLILEIVGRQFDVSRVYIYELSQGRDTLRDTFEWCADGVPSQMEAAKDLSCRKLGPLLRTLDRTGVFYSKDVNQLPDEVRELLDAQGIHSVLQCAIRDGSRLQGAVGFDECRSQRFWTREQIDTLSFVAQVVSIFLLKKRAQTQTEDVMRCMQAILDVQEALILAVDKESMEILYANRRACDALPDMEMGDRCYEIFHHEALLCPYCPAMRLNDNEKRFMTSMHIPALGRTMKVRATEINWVCGREVYLVSLWEKES